jgi:uncharacterized membrane protein
VAEAATIAVPTLAGHVEKYTRSVGAFHLVFFLIMQFVDCLPGSERTLR